MENRLNYLKLNLLDNLFSISRRTFSENCKAFDLNPVEQITFYKWLKCCEKCNNMGGLKDEH